MIWVIAFLVFAAPVFFAVLLTSNVSATVKIASTIGLLLLLTVLPGLLIAFHQI